jgi:thymidine phosphorylase
VLVIMRTDCHVCRAEGLAARSQVLVTAGSRHVHATLLQIEGDILRDHEIALSEAAWALLGVDEGDVVQVSHPPDLHSLAGVRRRIHGGRLDGAALNAIVRDVVAGHYTDVHLSAFLTASSALPLDDTETAALTKAMVAAGERLTWESRLVLDKHSIGGLPGNRTTPIVVAIVAALGLTIPKTSSRAITSPAGTADTMETLTRVDLDLPTLKRVVEAEGGCLAWGGAMRLSPADDMFIRIERVLDVDTEGQLVASVLSKKIAAGLALSERLSRVAAGFGLKTVCVPSDGTQPVGLGVGPSLEALDVLAVLQNQPDAPSDLRRQACALAGAALEMGEVVGAGEGFALASRVLADGQAWSKFQRICAAQGGLRKPPQAAQQRPIEAPCEGRITHIDNRKIARLAKLAGAPEVKAAGLRMEVRVGDRVVAGQPLVVLHAATPGELAYASDYVERNPDFMTIEQ